MKNYITPMALAVAVGMCGAVRPIQRIVLISGAPTTPAAEDELRLPAGTSNPENIISALQELLDEWKLPHCVESETETRDARFHELVDKEFLGNLTLLETQELEALTKWSNETRSEFYRKLNFD